MAKPIIQPKRRNIGGTPSGMSRTKSQHQNSSIRPLRLVDVYKRQEESRKDADRLYLTFTYPDVLRRKYIEEDSAVRTRQVRIRRGQL